MKTKTAIITGATSGLGEAYAKALASKGWNLLLTGRRMDRLSQLKQEFENSYGVDVKLVKADFTNFLEFENLLEEIKRLKNVDLLINNAGFGSRKGFFEEDYTSQQKMLQVHINATSRLTYEVVPKMIESKNGAVINVSSLSAFFPAPLNYFYCATKAFLVSFSECLHIDLLQQNIKVQALCPGFIKTEFHSRIHQKSEPVNWKERVMWMEPEEVVKYSLKHLSRKRVLCIPGAVNKLLYRVSAFVPKRLYYYLMEKNARKVNHPAEATLVLAKTKIAYV